MPLVKNKESLGSTNPSSPQEIKSIHIADPRNVVIATDNRYTPRINLITHVEGYEWHVDYYSQILTTESPLSGQQLSVNATNQQYNKINGLRIKVTSPLTQSQNEEDGSMVVVGESLLQGFIIPNQGDMFLADIGEGILGVFKITKSIKLSIYKETTYQVAYTLINDDEINIEDLNEKVVKTSYYYHDFVNLGKNPILVEDEYASVIELKVAYDTMHQQYFRRFFSKEFNTLLIPYQTQTIYDHFLTRFLKDIFDTNANEYMLKINTFNVGRDDNMTCDSLWSAIYYRNVSYLNTSFRRSGLISTKTFDNLAISCNIRYSGLAKVVYPRDPFLTVDGTIVENTKILSDDTLVQPTVNSQIADMIRAANMREVSNPITKESLYLVTKDDYYVLSLDFYNKTENMSILEAITWDYIEGKPLNPGQLLNVAKTFTAWGLLEQYYYVPIIMVMIRSIIGS